VQNVNSSYDCQEECQKSSNCNFFTFDNFNKNCLLKPYIEERLAKEGSTSGQKKCAEHMGSSFEHCNSTYDGNYFSLNVSVDNRGPQPFITWIVILSILAWLFVCLCPFCEYLNKLSILMNAKRDSVASAEIWNIHQLLHRIGHISVI